MSSSLGLSGLISGVDTDTIVEKLMEIESQRVTLAESRKEALQAKQSAWQEVRTSLSTLRSKLDAIRFASSYRARTATLTDESVASVKVNAGAVETTHQLQVVHLATNHVVASETWQSAAAQLQVSGKLQLKAGTSDTTSDGETPNDAMVEIEVKATDSLYSIRDKINNVSSKTGVTASVMPVATTDGTQYRLVLTAKESGLNGAITMSGDAAVGLGFQSENGDFAHQLVAAQNADFYLDGAHFTNQSSNEITDLLPGVTITLKKGGATTADPTASASTNITIGTDVDKISTAIQDWVSALNDAMDLLSDLTSYDKSTGKAGTLQGDSLARNLKTALRSMLSKQVAGLPKGFSSLSDIGITTGAYGTSDYGKVLVDEETLKAKLAEDAEGVGRVLGAIRQNVALASNGATVTATSTRDSDGTYVYAAEDVINGESSSDRYGSAGGGWASAAVPSADNPQRLTIDFHKKATVDEVQLYLADNANLKNFSVEYWDGDLDGDWETRVGQWKTLEAVENYTGSSIKSFDFDAVSTSAVRLSVTATKDGAPVEGVTELMVMQQNTGPALLMYQYVNSSLSSSGALTTRNSSLSDQIADIDDQIERIQKQLEAKEESLRKQFKAMEEALAELQSQGSLVLAQLNYSTSKSSSSK